jgi:uncharacterized protein (TIGR02996 family)
MPAGFEDALAKARQLLASGDLRGALTPLLQLWRQRRAPMLAALIESLSDRLVEPIEGRTLKKRLARWKELEAKQRAADLGTLLDAMREAPDTERRRQFEQLCGWPADPRIAGTVVELQFWTRTVGTRVLLQHADPRILEVKGVLEWAETSPRSGAAKVVARLRESFPDGQPALAEDESAELAAFAEELAVLGSAEHTEAKLLAEVFAEPDQEQPRLVLADLLLEKGDSRGELIQLQCLSARQELSAAQRRRVAALLRDHRQTCHGALAPVIAGGEVARGFLHRVRLKNKPALLRELATSPDWATVKELDVADVWRSEQAPVAIAQLPRLSALVGLRAETVNALFGKLKHPLPLEILGCFLNDHTHKMVALKSLLAATNKLPHLSRLVLGGAPVPKDQGWLFGGSALGQQLRAVEVPHPGWATAWLRQAEASESLEELVLREDADSGFERYGWTLVFRRGDKGRFAVVTALHDGRRRVARWGAPFERLAEDLSRLPAKSLDAFCFGKCRGLSNEGRDALKQALARQKRLGEVQLPR